MSRAISNDNSARLVRDGRPACFRKVAVLTAGLMFFVQAFGQAVRNVDINVVLSRDGSALVSEKWDVNVVRGTEWYLVRNNLDDIEISDLLVVDETGRVFENEGRWDVERSLSGKAGRCGIVSKGNGCEICWGLGSYGDHIYTVSYRMSNVVKSLDEADMLHVQFISAGLSSAPQKARVSITLSPNWDATTTSGASDQTLASGNTRISANGTPLLDTLNTRVWGFGYYGNIYVADNAIVASSSEPFAERSSMIVLARFDKGIFEPTSVMQESFESHLTRALKGSDYVSDSEEKHSILYIVLMTMTAICSVVGVILGLAIPIVRARNRKMFGVSKMSEIGWSRDVPFGGDIFPSYQVLVKLAKGKVNNLASAMILQMIQEGYINVTKDSRGRVELSFNDEKDRSVMYTATRRLYEMMREASGKDKILQKNEFSRWSRRHRAELFDWNSTCEANAAASLSKGGYVEADRFNKIGQGEARKVVGLKKFLNDATLLSERSTPEVTLWREYMIYAALFGVAEKVARELKDINPRVFEEAMSNDFNTSVRILYLSNLMGTSITTAVSATAGRAGGGGGFSSFGGGGGFSGGGFGGGCR